MGICLWLQRQCSYSSISRALNVFRDTGANPVVGENPAMGLGLMNFKWRLHTLVTVAIFDNEYSYMPNGWIL